MREGIVGEQAQAATDRAEFLAGQRAYEQQLFDQGYTFAGNLRPRRISGLDYDEQLAEIASRLGVQPADLVTIGDVMSVHDGDPTVRELIVLYDYVSAYAPPVSSPA